MTATTTAPAPPPRCIHPVHTIPGRARLRLSWLHDAPAAEAERIADGLTRLPGMREVQVRRFTGSVICLFDAERLAVSAILDELARLTGAEVTEAGPRIAARRRSVPNAGPGEVARQLAQVFKHLDDDILTATDGKLDLGTLATFSFLGAGAVNVAFGRKISAPPWFNLAWWGLRTFMLFEADAVEEPAGPGTGPDPNAEG